MKKIFFVLSIIAMISYSAKSAYSQLDKTVDEFSGKITYRTPYGKSMTLLKVIQPDKKDTLLFLRLHTCGSTLNIGEKGVIILFTDGTKITFDEKIKLDASAEGCDYDYSAYCFPKKEDIDLFFVKTVKAFRLYIYDHHVDDEEAKKFQENAKLIANAH